MTLFVDSSVWIDYFNGKETPQTDYLDKAIGEGIVVVGDLILAEVLQGFRLDKDFIAAKSALTSFPVFNMINQAMAIQSAANYRLLRKNGVTVRKTIDCLIATFCIENRFMLLHADRDFNHFEHHLGLQIWCPNKS